MSLLFLFGSGDGTSFVSLPEVAHLYDPYKTYMASRTVLTDEKDPSDVVDRLIDWAPLLGEDTIATSSWSIPTGITADSGSNTTTTTTVWVSGGTAGEDYYLINRIVTTDGRTFERFIIVPVRQK